MIYEERNGPDRSAFAVGEGAVRRVIAQEEEYCAYEMERIEKANAGSRAALELELKWNEERERELTETLPLYGDGDAAIRMQKIYFTATTVVFCFASIIFAYVSLQPFGLGLEILPAVLGLGLILAFWTHPLLENEHARRFIGGAGFVCAILGVLFTASVRGSVFALQVNEAMTGEATSPEQGALFYKSSAVLLGIFLGLLSVAMELAAAWAWRELLKLHSETPPAQIRRERDELRKAIVEAKSRLALMDGEPVMFRDEHMSEALRGIRSAAEKGLEMIFISLGLVIAARVQAQPAVEIGLDLTDSSVKAVGYDGRSELDRNLDALSGVISGLPPGTHLRVAAITDQTFSRPFVLTATQLPRDKGPLMFLDRVAASKTRAIGSVQSRARHVHFDRSDIAGFFLYAADALRGTPQDHKIIVIFSDMRQCTDGLDLDSMVEIDPASALRTAANLHLIADLRGADVYVSGVHAAGKTPVYWQELRDFWTQYFAKAGANLRAFSANRDLTLATGTK